MRKMPRIAWVKLRRRPVNWNGRAAGVWSGASSMVCASRSNENKIRYGYRHRGLLEVNVVQSSENVNLYRVAVTCIAWLDGRGGSTPSETPERNSNLTMY